MTDRLHCQKCLTSRSGDTLGAACRTPGCPGTVERAPFFSELVAPLPERFTCGRRGETWLPKHLEAENQDYWQQFKSNGNRVCSYCGSLHPDDLFRLVKECGDAPVDAAYGSVPEIERTDKNYKLYVRQPGVRNAHEGGIKFYMQHLPRDSAGNLAVTEAQHAEYDRALRASARRAQNRSWP